VSDTSLIFNLLAIDKVTGVLGGVKGAFGGFAIGVGIAAAEAGDHMLKMAGDFQQGITRLETGAGESKANLALVSQGILDMAGQVGESTKDLNAGMYLVESAGFHAAAGLDVLKAAAEGAKVGNADMATVADAVTTGLNAYHLSADKATQVTNALVAAEGQGKTNLEALSGSLSTVAPIASLAGISLNEVLAAMSTMTAQGTPAADAATYLKQTIGQLSNPTQKARSEMSALGLDATKVSMNLGKNGLASTLTMLTDAIKSKMGPAGTVLLEKLQKASKSTTEFQKILANLPPTQQTFIGALATMVGGTKSMQAALELTGDNMKVFRDNTDVINQKVAAGGDKIEGWAEVQGNFNQRMSEAKGTLEALGIKIGTALLPKAQQVLDVTMKTVGWFTKHKDVARDLAVTIGVLAGAVLLYKTYMLAARAAMIAWQVITGIMTAAQWLLNIAMDANPVGLVIIAIAALVGGIYLLWTNSAGFRDFFIGLWGHIWDVLKAIGGWFAGPFVNFFVDAWHVINHAWDAAIAWFESVPGKLGDLFNSVGRFIATPIVAALNYVSDAWNNTIGRLSWTVPDWVPIIGGKTISAPHLPHFAVKMAHGGLVMPRPGGTLAELGEAGQPEIASPVPLLRQIVREESGRRGGVERVELDFGGARDDLVRAVVAALAKYAQVNANGNLQVAITGKSAT